VGATLALWGIRIVRAIGGFPEVIEPSANALVMAFTAGVTALTGVLCGLVPALRASGSDPRAALSARGAAGPPRGRLRAVLVSVQVALAVVLGSCGLLLIQSTANRQRVDLGFDPSRSIQGGLSLDGDRYADAATVTTTTEGLLATISRHDFVEAAGAITWALPTPAGAQRQFSVVAPAGRGELILSPGVRRGVEAVTPRYFTAMGVALTAGRAFSDGDRAGTQPVTIVNDELARHLWPDRSPVGEQLRLGAEPGAPVATVVGVVRSIRRSAMHDVVVARAYVPFAQYPNRQLTIVVRGRSDVAPLAEAVRQDVVRADPMLMVERLRPTVEDLAGFVAPLRMITWLLAAFAAAATLLTALGVYGTMSCTVNERERELAVRAALGADARSLLGLVLRHGARLALIGIVPGTALAIVGARFLASFLFGVTPGDPATLASVVAILAIVSVAACVRPARLAATTDPMTVLRRD
jgi:predicted permease